jgi:transcriptional regulator with XRE-family HTH domain
MTMGERIRKHRQTLGISQQALADRVGVRRATISEFESGKRLSMTTDTAKRLARILGVSVDYLIDTYGEEGEGIRPHPY